MELKDLTQLKLAIACSGGPDSMALFDMCLSLGIEVVVLHVNYHRRPTADRDEQIVKDYCQKHQVELEVLSPEFESGNFQNWAREVRYEFFAKMVKKHQLDGVLVAHHEDDVIETYLFQKQRKMIPESYGMSETREIMGCQIYRPLLKLRKQDLMEYCQNRGIVYGLDESNETDDYERNRIRHHQVEVMSESERRSVLSDLRMDQLDLMIVKEMVETVLKRHQNVLPCEVFERLSELEKIVYLHRLILMHTGKSISTKECQDLIRQLSGSSNVEISLSNCVKLSKMYGLLEISKSEDVLYSYVLDKLEMMETPYFKISHSGQGTEAVTLTEDDFPLTVRNAQPGDAISLRFGTKKVNRWFIDRKIARKHRRMWPVVLNRHQKVVLVPGIGCDCEHYSNNPSCFVVK